MDTARIEKRIGIRASTDAIWEVISNLPGWNDWNPCVRVRDGGRANTSEAMAIRRVGLGIPLVLSALRGCIRG